MSEVRDGDSDASYSPVAKVLHWLIALGVIALLVLGTIMTRRGFSIQTTIDLYQIHKSLGVSVFVLMLGRLAWRMLAKPPAVPDGMDASRHRMAVAVHVALYSLLLTLPVVGWLQVSAAPIAFPTVLIGAIEVPPLQALARLPYEQRVEWSHLFGLLHRWMAWAMATLAAVHVAGAFIRQANGRRSLRRMWW
jgi:cytochrome b561